ncbi:unnamed protein product [Rhizophagus irregularis]|nr:unnamed protein product [Rhizophagus irregularis]
MPDGQGYLVTGLLGTWKNLVTGLLGIWKKPVTGLLGTWKKPLKYMGRAWNLEKPDLGYWTTRPQKIWIYKFLDLKNLGTSNLLDELNTRGTPDKIMNWTLRKVLPDELTNRILAKGNITR